MDVETGTDRGQRLERPGPYRLAIPPAVLGGTEFEGDGEAVLTVDTADGYPRLVCRPAGRAETGVTRRLSTRPGESRPGLTLPVEAVEAGGLVGTHAVPYAGADGRLYVGFGRESRLDDPTLVEQVRAYVSRLRGGELSVSLPAELAGPLAAVDRLSVWLDVHDGRPAILLGAPSVAPRGAIEVTADPNTGRESTEGLALYLPRVPGRLLGVGGRTLRWGRTADGNRILGVGG